MRSAVLLCLLLSTLLVTRAQAEVVITEVYYCHGPVDDQYEWVELYNGSTEPFFLDGYVLAWGGFDYSWGSITFGAEDLIPPCFRAWTRRWTSTRIYRTVGWSPMRSLCSLRDPTSSWMHPWTQ